MGFIVEGYDGTTLELPVITECSEITDNIFVIPTPEVTELYPHLQNIASKIPDLDEKARIMLLIGRDLAEAHHVKSEHKQNFHSRRARVDTSFLRKQIQFDAS